jgi:ABC-type dipeptide/oligopeptide/nickel transport system permease component
MGRYLIRRFVQTVVVFAGVTFVIYGAVFLIPGNPVATLGGGQPLPATTVHDLELKYRLNEPFFEQYARYLAGVSHGDFGTSISTGQSISSLMGQAWPVTLTLALTAWAIEIIVGVGSGIAAALRRGGVFDRLMMFGTILAVSVSCGGPGCTGARSRAPPRAGRPAICCRPPRWRWSAGPRWAG